MIEPNLPGLSVGKQCALLSISRSSFYYEPKGESEMNLDLMRVIDKQFLEAPFYGVRQMTRHLRNDDHLVNEKRVRRLMRLMGLMAIYQKPNTSKAAKGHKIYPYLLRGLRVDQPNQVWCADITYLPMRRGFLYLVAIMDWATRKVLSWRLSNTLDASFCVEALDEAIAKYGKPVIMNTDSRACCGKAMRCQHLVILIDNGCDVEVFVCIDTTQDWDGLLRFGHGIMPFSGSFKHISPERMHGQDSRETIWSGPSWARGILETRPHREAFPGGRQVQGKTRVRSIGIRVKPNRKAKRHQPSERSISVWGKPPEN